MPRNRPFLPAVFGSALLAAHAIVAVLLLGAAVAGLVRAVRIGRARILTAAGLAAVAAAGVAGSAFVSSESNGSSLAMALAAAGGMLCYLAAVFSLR